MPIEKGQFMNIERHGRKCPHCNTIGDEYHYLFECIFFSDERKNLLKPYFYTHTNTLKFSQLFNSKYNVICKLSKFVKIIMSHFK